MTDLASSLTLETAAGWVVLVLVALLLAGLVLQRRRVLRSMRVGTARLRYAEGVRAGQNDRNREWKPGQPLYAECPYEEGSDDHFIWLEGYLDASHLVMPSLPVASSPGT